MTKIKYQIMNDEFEIEVKGHAGYAAVGNDIVCSAISILVQTLAYHMEDVAEDHNYKLSSGEVWIRAKGETAMVSFKTILTGLVMLQEQYPEYISVTEGCTINPFADLIK